MLLKNQKITFYYKKFYKNPLNFFKKNVICITTILDDVVIKTTW